MIGPKPRQRGPRLLRGLTAVLMLVLAAIVPTLVWTGRAALIAQETLASLALLVVLQLMGLRAFRVHRRNWQHFGLTDAAAVAKGLLVGTVAYLVLGLVAIEGRITALDAAATLPPELVGTIVLLSINLQLLVRTLGRLTGRRRGHPDAARTSEVALLVGTGGAAAAVLRDVATHRIGHLKVVGLLADDARRGDLILGSPVLGGLTDLETLSEQLEVEVIVIALDEIDDDLVRSIITRAQTAGLRVRIRPPEPLIDVTHEAQSVSAVDVARLMPRDVAQSETGDIAELVAGRSVVITGAGGSIGSGLARQLIHHNPSRLTLIDRSESALWTLQRELEEISQFGVIDPVVLDIRDQQLLTNVLSRHAPIVVLHAAGFKQVPMLERNAAAAVLNNIIGTASVAEACLRTGVTRLVLVSTDQAHAAVNVLGASQRLAERVISDAAARSGRDFVSVRLGTVLDSSGGVLEVFESQIASGGPITITDPDMTRNLLTVAQAGSLVLHAAAMRERGDLLVATGDGPRRIVELAEDLVRLHGLEPGQDIHLVVTGRRAGEPLHAGQDPPDAAMEPTDHPFIRSLSSSPHHWPDRDKVLVELRDLARANATEPLRARLLEIAGEEVAGRSVATALSGSRATNQ